MSRKVLITGAGGFIGSHLAELCVEEGYSVKAFLRYNSRGFCGWLDESPYKGEIEVEFGDIRDYDAVRHALDGCSWVFHLAALIGIPYSYRSPVAYVKTNIEGTCNVLEAARKSGAENVIVTSTSETYGTAQTHRISEEHPLVAQSPYAASKVAADQLALSFYRSFDLPVRIVRPFNTYGPRQSARAVTPTIITQILCKERTVKLGNTAAIRDLTFVKDVVAGFVEIAKTDRFLGEVTNIGSDSEVSVSELAERIAKVMNAAIATEQKEDRVRPEKSEVDRLRCDNTKIVQNTSWRPRYDLEGGIAATVDWLQSHLEYYKPEIYNI